MMKRLLFQLLFVGIVFLNLVQSLESNPGSILGKSSGKDDHPSAANIRNTVGRDRSEEDNSHEHNDKDDRDDDDNMSAGTISGIGIGMIAIVGVVGVSGFMLHKRRSFLKQSGKNNATVGFAQNQGASGSGASVTIAIPSAPEDSKVTANSQIQELRVPTSDDEDENELPPSYESVVLN